MKTRDLGKTRPPLGRDRDNAKTSDTHPGPVDPGGTLTRIVAEGHQNQAGHSHPIHRNGQSHRVDLVDLVLLMAQVSWMDRLDQ